MLIKKFNDKYVLGVHYGVVTFIPVEQHKGDEYGNGYSFEELLNFNYFDCETLKSILKFYDKYKENEEKKTHNLTVDDTQVIISFLEESIVISVNNEKIEFEHELLECIRTNLKNSDSDLSKSYKILPEMSKKANGIRSKHEALKDINDEDLLFYADSNKLEELIASCTTA